MRRQLELSLVQPLGDSAEAHQTLLSTIEKFHRALNELSDNLAPPYLGDSLPLAIQSAMETWKAHHPQYPLKLELPAEWGHESPEQGRILLTTLAELLRLTLLEVQATQVSIAVRLTAQAQFNELKLQLSGPAVTAIATCAGNTEFDQLSRAFCFLMSGKCCHQRHDQTVVWCLRWYPSPT